MRFRNSIAAPVHCSFPENHVPLPDDPETAAVIMQQIVDFVAAKSGRSCEHYGAPMTMGETKLPQAVASRRGCVMVAWRGCVMVANPTPSPCDHHHTAWAVALGTVRGYKSNQPFILCRIEL